MTRMLFTIAVAIFCTTATAAEQPVTFNSPCECSGAHGKGRWAVKNDRSTPSTDASAIQAVVPSDVFSWPGIEASLTWQSERTGIENKWFAFTGRVVAVKVEADGDLHIALANATGGKPGIVVCQVPQSRNGATFGQLFSVGRGRDSLCTFARQENLRSTKRRSSLSLARRFGT